MSDPRRVVVVGGGFGGLYAARELRREPVDLVLVDRRNFHLFQPLLYQVATGGLSPANVATPLRYLLRRQRNARVVLGEVVDFDLERKRVLLRDGELPYDELVVAAGARVDYFGHDDWRRHAPGLKDVEDARDVRRRVLSAFERAERLEPGQRVRWLTFAVVGGGPTGVELAGALAELARETLPKDFRRADVARARIVLVEGGPRLLSALPPRLSERAERALERLGVEVWTDAMVESIDEGGVRVARDGDERELEAGTVLWAAGVSASPLGRTLAERAGAELDRGGRVVVGGDCSLPGHPEVFVVGDLARFDDEEGEPLPGVAPVAMQQGRHVARVIARRAAGGTGTLPFRYRDKGDLATIGRSAAVARIGRFQFSGLPAWLAWLLVHLMYLTEVQNRLLVLVQWAWNYATWNRSARLITPPDDADATG